MEIERPFAPGVLDPYITKPELAAQLGVSTSALERLCARRAGPPWIKLGRKTLFKRADVEAWLEARPKCGAVAGPGR